MFVYLEKPMQMLPAGDQELLETARPQLIESIAGGLESSDLLRLLRERGAITAEQQNAIRVRLCSIYIECLPRG